VQEATVLDGVSRYIPSLVTARPALFSPPVRRSDLFALWAIVFYIGAGKRPLAARVAAVAVMLGVLRAPRRK
jgi:hypothetical protein